MDNVLSLTSCKFLVVWKFPNCVPMHGCKVYTLQILVLFGMSSKRGSTGILLVAIAICELSKIAYKILNLKYL